MGVSSYWLPASLSLGALICGAFALLAARLPVFPGRTHFIVTQSALFWWTACDAIEHLQQQPENAQFWAEFAHLGIFLGPGCWGLFVWNYIYGRYKPSPRALDLVLVLTSVAVWLTALTNDDHHLIYRQIIQISPPPHALFAFTHGPVYLVYHAVLFTNALIAYCIVIYAAIQADRIYRQHYIGLALGTTFPWIANALFVAGVLHLPFDVTPFTIFLSNAIFYWLIRKRQMFDLLPIAHGLLLDVIPDPILVLDGRGRVAECNEAARRLAGTPHLIGQWLNGLPALEGLAQPQVEGGELALGAPPRPFDVGATPLSYAGLAVGRLVLLRDISHRKQVELELREAKAELERQLEANLELQRQLKEETIHDPLTGLHNRRFFDGLAPVLTAEADRSGQPLALVMIDIDHFKRLNDGYGHQAGDAVLRAMGTFLRANSRQSDAAVRFGGEEFLILMPHTQAHQAVARIEGWRSAFAQQTIEHGGHTLTATFSAGIALYPDQAPSLEETLRRADLALYQAKGDGRNRSVAWTG